MDKKKILIIAVVGVVVLLVSKKKKETVTENYSKAEGLTSAAGGFASQLNDIAQNAIDNATEQVIKLGDNIARWSTHRYNNAKDNYVW
ncbi:MAG: hypothetical protein IKN49_04555 [Elusimicrobiaceae bacterium]|nr:hypothetical protein [Candidatus Saccharibacteria bacterium]MBR3204223.1 hypothetical protein [Candidatus Saccharibacteria bacterium]MBR3632307.1 hypothetical protein [Elusimicrobiaceae bacterium]